MEVPGEGGAITFDIGTRCTQVDKQTVCLRSDASQPVRVRHGVTGILDGCGEADEATLVAAGEENPLASLKPTFDLPSDRRFMADLRLM